jgi:DNA helicase-2/ATP-dependent DNA helicase PcrA
LENRAIDTNPAKAAAEQSLRRLYECLGTGRSFLLEAGAGSGKTYSLVKALQHLIDNSGKDLARRSAKIACITFTNVASDEIKSRIDSHPAVVTSTIHAFCWSLVKDFQPFLRSELENLPKWAERLAEGGGIAGRDIEYELGFPSAKAEDSTITLHHDDVLAFMVRLMAQPKFRRLFATRYPVLFIDEYQDTNKDFVESIRTHFLGKGGSPLIGFFGDHWQKIFPEGCGKIEHEALVIIEQKANFRSVVPIVEILNRMRPELPQAFSDPASEGYAAVFHSNGWTGGARRTGQGGGHWTGDLPAAVAHMQLGALRARLGNEGWDFSPDKTKILMLTHNVLAAEQGYDEIAKVFPRNESFIKKEDRHIKFLLETVEPVSTSYENERFGEMFAALDTKTPKIRSYADKAQWSNDMTALLGLRTRGSVGDVLDHLKATKRPRLPDSVERREWELEQWVAQEGVEEPSSLERLRKLRAVPYRQVMALARFVDDHTPFATKHGVKGAEFENVLVVAGRGWNHYNFSQLLEWFGNPASIPADRSAFERNRNLFYVACSRPKKRLAILFTQELSQAALDRLGVLFGADSIHAFNP